MGVAANQGTLEAICADLVGTPDPETIRDYINEQICGEEWAQLEAQLNKALVDFYPYSPRFAKFIVRALERHYGYVRSMTAVALPLL